MIDIVDYKNNYSLNFKKIYRSAHNLKIDIKDENKFTEESNLNIKLFKKDEKIIGYVVFKKPLSKMHKDTVRIDDIYIQKPYDLSTNYIALLESTGRGFLFKHYKYAKIYMPFNKRGYQIAYKLGIYPDKKLYEMKTDLYGNKKFNLTEGVKFLKFRKGIDEIKRMKLQNLIFKDTDDHIDISIDDIIYEESQNYFLEDGGIFLSVNGILAGYSQIILEDENEPKPYIVNFGILENFRNRGFGKLLLDYTLNLIKSKGFKEAYITVDSKNIKAYNLYKKCGFEKTFTLCSYTYKYRSH